MTNGFAPGVSGPGVKNPDASHQSYRNVSTALASKFFPRYWRTACGGWPSVTAAPFRVSLEIRKAVDPSRDDGRGPRGATLVHALAGASFER